MDLNEIKRKVENRMYDSFYAMEADVECIYHNCSVNVHGENCCKLFSDVIILMWLSVMWLSKPTWFVSNILALRDKAALASDLLQFVKIECKKILVCPGCYKNIQLHPNRWGEMACDQHHPLLWLKVTPNLRKILVGERSTRWPAKVLLPMGKELLVYLFGYSQTEGLRVPNVDWLPYTGKPISKLWTRDKPAMQVMWLIFLMFSMRNY